MSITKDFFKVTGATKSQPQNKIVSYSKIDLKKSKSYVYSIGDKVITGFIIAALYLFSALEEADWCIFSSNQKNNDHFTDNSIWNIYKLIPLSKFN